MYFRVIKLIIWIVIIYSVVFYINYRDFKNQTLIEDKYITIENWDTLYWILENLWYSKKYLKFYLYFNPLSDWYILQKWNYKLEAWSKLKNIIISLKKPINTDKKLTFLEWWNIYDIDEYLYSTWLINKWDFINYSMNVSKDLKEKYPFLEHSSTLEWFLYPDTYFINPNIFSIEILVKKMLDNFKSKVYDKILTKYTNIEIINIINLASIVEKEANHKDNPEEVAIIAWILNKRLNEWRYLWADATICYPYKLTSKKCTPVFIWNHINDINNYNTRQKLWLPKTPIWNPSFKSINATINYKKTPYYYYLHDNNWQIHYATTNDEHINNKNTWLK